MAQSRKEFKEAVKRFLKQSGTSASSELVDIYDIDQSVNQSINTFSKDKPRIIKEDVSADGSYEYSLPDLWVSDFSFIMSIEYPAGEQAPSMLDPEDYNVYHNGTTEKLRFPALSPQSGESMLVEFTVKWTLDKTTCNIPTHDYDAVICLAASYCLRMFASYYAQTSDPTIDVDTIDYSNKSIQYSELADNLENIYRRHLGLAPLGSKEAAEKPSSPAAGQQKDLDIDFAHGEQFLTHPRRWR